MKRLFLSVLLLSIASASAQQHFSGINTSSRTSIISGNMNPAEFANISSKYEVNILGLSLNASSNKVGFSDLVGGADLADLIFEGSDAANLRIDGEIAGPGVAYTMEKWTFAFTTKAYAKLDLVDIDVAIGDAIANAGINSLSGSSTISNSYNQRMNGTTWGEIGLSAARELFSDETQSFNAGASFKLLFPGSYANFGASQFNGTINNTLTNATLTDAQANLNIAYSGNLGEDFTNFNDYSSSLFGKLNGFAVDLGVSYRLKDNVDTNRYKLNAGLSIRNIGGMTFKSGNNSSTNYQLSIQGAESLNLNQFEDVTSLQEVEAILLESGYLNRDDNSSTDFKVKLPTVFSVYADIKIIPDLYVTAFTQQKLNKNDSNDQIATENIVSVTPRYLLSNIEFFLPLSINEIAGFTGGVGFRAYGFYLGSSSILTALINDSKQADVFIGYTFGLQ